ncbi:MAG: hypothetical protein HN356_12605 [Calditrichaeota bacterium]|nr:hypothetical protein [Calditrichota bacterium]MBT7617259.1 hypothetical protein [Calditrichota bacterium]MBT7790694.1 hypothetical protein [Calditrichota bacterium]
MANNRAGMFDILGAEVSSFESAYGGLSNRDVRPNLLDWTRGRFKHK